MSKRMSDGSTYYGPDEWSEYVDAFWHPKEWINSEWSKAKQDAFNNLYDLGVLGWYPFRDEFDKILNDRNNELYMGRYDLDYSDVKDPRKLSTTSSVKVLGNGINFVSSNIKRLYR